LPENALIKYEDLIATRARELAKFFPTAAGFEEDLVSKNLNKYYDRGLMMDLGQRLLKRGGPLWHFYGRPDVEKLLSEAGASATRG
jgi:hypothetical protein